MCGPNSETREHPAFPDISRHPHPVTLANFLVDRSGSAPTTGGTGIQRAGPAPQPALPAKQSDVSTSQERFLPALAPAPSPNAQSGIAVATAGSLASTNDMLQALKQKAIDRSREQYRQVRSKSVPRSAGSCRGDSGRIRQGRPQLPLRRPEKVDTEELNRNVASKLQPLEAVTNSILSAVEERKGGGGGAPLAKATCKDFVVGRAACNASSVVTLYADRLEYKFSHSSQGRIDMVMYFKDMLTPELDRRGLVLKFRIGKPLRHFIDAYDCTDPQHILSLTFYEKADALQFQDLLLSSCKVPLQIVGEQ
ncbi:hypothetical protein VOLCADRAFT_106308 [Volvox carteri f. nagariensis]|uniref:Uncharacterized protein n=1 Tax=Volvox carteri f. nagariensis TaxID=3068 RepID=D8U6G9_VOLCA|nr:uncharacterized protein VOLCADRAFT_106308 [Volvox carteri f. nagariensis]EFJ44711.1 hypothetical protein VOLCADRAFT_106308 [Volvox carteri f. nagariensis]|eukprot:XP_002954287.1 hypothetical protein VOLCADRAFT_106308 [Volvox carteri f. nagariensis]